MLIQNGFLKLQRLEKRRFFEPDRWPIRPPRRRFASVPARGHWTAMAGVQSLLSKAHALYRYSDASERQPRALLGEL
jgi:hypothetical protein